jgi:hypothetical protein
MFGSLTLSRTPEDFNAIGKGSLYYLFLSMIQFHAYIGEMRTSMGYLFDQIERSVGTIQQILQLPDGKSDKPLNIFTILGSASTLAAAVPGNPGWQGAMAAAAGVFGLTSELAPKS